MLICAKLMGRGPAHNMLRCACAPPPCPLGSSPPKRAADGTPLAPGAAGGSSGAAGNSSGHGLGALIGGPGAGFSGMRARGAIQVRLSNEPAAPRECNTHTLLMT
jgi:hypothetical protein